MWGRWEIQTVDLYMCLESLPCWRTGSAASTSFVRVLRLCRGWNRRRIFSAVNRLRQTAPAERRLIFSFAFFFFIKLFIPRKSRSSWRLGSSKGKLRGPGPASGTSLLGAGQRNAAHVTNPVLPIASPAGAESNFLTRLKCFFQPPPAEPVR